MKVIIPVAGIGKRLKPHTDSIPKPLLEVGGQPILDHVMKPLDGLDVDEVMFVIGHLGEQIRKYARDNYSFEMRFVQQDHLKGLGYAVSMALQEIDSSPVLILLGDTIVDCDMQKFVNAGECVLGVHEVSDPERFGIVELSGGYVSSLEEKPEKPKSNLALIGLYYFNDATGLKNELHRLVASGHTTNGEVQLTDALAAMLAGDSRFVAYDTGPWYDCGTKETLLATNRFLLGKMDSAGPRDGCVLIPPVHLDVTAVVTESEIGPHVSIGAGANLNRCVISNSIVGPDCELENVAIKNSLLGPKAIVRNRSGVLNIGEHSEIEGG